MSRRWKYTLNFRLFWNNDEMMIEEKGKRVCKEIYRVFPQSNLDSEMYGKDHPHISFSDILELEDMAEGFNNITGYGDVSPIEEFDNWLESLYNWADSNDVWVATRF